MKKLILILVSTLITSFNFAANVSWLGGTGNWNTAAKWSTGAVPTANDDVTISGGTVNINAGVAAFAKSVLNQNTGTLTIKAGGSLTISGSTKSFALSNYNRLIVRGFLHINDTNGMPSKGLYNRDTVEVQQAGVLEIEGFYYGIDNWVYFNNLGVVNISSSETCGIQQFVAGAFSNAGNLSINSNGTGIFQNSGSVFTNSGNLDIVSNNISIISQESDITNTTSGVINISYTEYAGVWMETGGAFINRGDLVVSNAAAGITFSSLTNQIPGPAFENTETGYVAITADEHGVSSTTTMCAFTNSGIMELTAGTYCINNPSPSFINNVCAELYVNGQIYNSATGVIQNNAKWVMNSTAMSFNAGSFQNLGILEDNNAVLSPLITNSRLVVRPINGPLTAGVPVENVLDVASWGTFQSLGIFIDEAATTYAGTFGQVNNRFTPNASAVGLSNLYIKIRRGAIQCPEVMRIEVLNPVPLMMPNGGSNVVGNPEQAQVGFSVFPNPTTGRFSLRGSGEEGPVSVHLTDALGRIIISQNIDFQAIETFQFEEGQIPREGLYFLKIMENGVDIWQEKLLITRH